MHRITFFGILSLLAGCQSLSSTAFVTHSAPQCHPHNLSCGLQWGNYVEFHHNAFLECETIKGEEHCASHRARWQQAESDMAYHLTTQP